jgi:hypothetical protein
MKNDQLEATTCELDAAGVAYTVEKTRHIKVRWTASGKPRMCVMSSTRSDFRATLNARATVRRLLRQDGVLR